ncbi:GNAT family N-acetyltransferase [Endozoicomonadaceae bacterium StTr2]
MKIEFSHKPSEQDITAIYEGLVEFNQPEFPDFEEQPIACFIKGSDGKIAGGLTGEILYQNIFVKYFWLSRELRGQGYGTALLQRLEQEAQKAGVEQIMLDTFSFQAPEFYKKYGFREIGRFDDYPKQGVAKIFLTKKVSEQCDNQCNDHYDQNN